MQMQSSLDNPDTSGRPQSVQIIEVRIIERRLYWNVNVKYSQTEICTHVFFTDKISIVLPSQVSLYLLRILHFASARFEVLTDQI